MIKKYLLASVASLAICSSAAAYTVTIDTAVPPASAYNFFNAYVGQTGTYFNPLVTPLGDFWGNATIYAQGTYIPGVVVPTGSGAFMGVGPTADGSFGNENLELPGFATAFSLVWGSADSYNTIELVNTVARSATILSGAAVNNILNGAYNSLVTFSDVPQFNEVQFHSIDPAFEFSLASPSVAAVPELPTGWMLLMALAILGLHTVRSRIGFVLPAKPLR